MARIQPAQAIRTGASTPADKYVVWMMLILSAIGVVAVYSAITFLAETKADGDTELFLFRHMTRLGMAFGAMAIFSIIDYRRLVRYSRLALLISIGLLLAVQIVGIEVFGGLRWIAIGSFGFQPSDLAKVALILYVVTLVAKKQVYVKSFSRSFVPLFLWILGTVVLIGIADLSSATVVLTTAILICFIGRVSILQISGLGIVAAGLALLLLIGSPGRAARVEAYLGTKIFSNTEADHVFDQQNEGYQAHQARIAFAMGGLTGVGPGKSSQRDFLPAPYNDFIYAIVAEEYGIIGALALLTVFVVLLFRGFLRIARYAPDPLGLFLGAGLTTMIVLYGFIHAGVACGLLPVTGLPMPFVSYGGTSMMATGIMVGILLNISRQIGETTQK